MNKLIERLIASNFADLAGLEITGTIPVKQDLLNEALSEVLAGGLPTSAASSGAPPSPAATSSSAPRAPRLDVNELLKLVKRAEITAHEGEIRLEFEVRR